MPTKKEREEHDALSMPFKSWCRHCVRGRGRNNPHNMATEEDEEEKGHRVSRISMDYHFMSQEEEKAGRQPMPKVVGESSGAIFMRAIGRKGLGKDAYVEWLRRSKHGHTGARISL